jgi:methylmalonyl-CoA mutase N-terminal domain/subunit
MATRPKDSQEAVDEDLHRYIAPVVGPDDERVFTDSGIEIKPLYDEDDVAPGLEERLGEPGESPFTRGIHERMYRDRLWTMRQYAGFASPEDTNERYRYLTEHGSTGLSMAFDLPTQLGRDSDDPLCEGEVGRTGVPIDTLEDMRICFDQISLAEVSTSMTINAPAAILLLLYELVGEEQGVPSAELRGTVQNDVLKEYVSRGNYIYPPEATMRLTTDIFAYCDENVPKWNTISISGYHMREKGCSAVQEVAFTLANAIAYVEGGIAAGLDVNRFGKRLAFFFNGHNNVFQEIAKFRAVRRMWDKIMGERFGATEEKARMIRFHTQTGGVTLQAQQPEVNIIRVALQGFAAVAGGTQSLHTNGFDEALALPTERSARIALRTQQVLAHESGVADTVDPFAGSYFIENLTDEIEQRSWDLMKKVEDLGGSVNSLEFMQREIEESANSYHERYRTGQDIVVGVNKYESDVVDDVEILRVDPESERRQLERLKKWKANRKQDEVDARLADLRKVAEGDGNLLPPIKEALRAGGSIGEVCNAMRDVFGEYRGGAFF